VDDAAKTVGRGSVDATVKRIGGLLLAVLVLALTACASGHVPQVTWEAGATYGLSQDTRFEWKSSTPEAQGFDSRDLTRALERVRRQDIALHGLIVYRNGYVILEVYPAPYDADTLHNVKSVSKSLLSALVGIAIDEGTLPGIDERVSAYFPEYFEEEPDPRKQDLSLRHLLTMTSGLDLDEHGPKMKAVVGSDDWIGAVLRRPMLENPGQRFSYSTGLTHVMSGVLTRASQDSLLAFCQRTLCGSLGFEDVVWRTDPAGYYFGGAELYLKPRDMLKLGVLYLNEGRWGRQQLVSPGWVGASTRDQLGQARSEQPYGFWWWLVDGGYMATGWGGQRLLVVPGKKLVIAATFADDDGFKRMFSDLDVDRLAPSPLPPNPSAVASLRATVTALEDPPSRPEEPLPPLAHGVSGKTFTITSQGDPTSITGISLDFSHADSYSVTLCWGETSRRFSLGLDGRFRLTPAEDPRPAHHPVTSTGRFAGSTALRGRWLGGNTLELEFVPIGEPVHLGLRITFHRAEVRIRARMRPTGREWDLAGAVADRDSDAADRRYARLARGTFPINEAHAFLHGSEGLL
jgi:CubicO group peptidase (beta-lactamase class C family)